MHYYVAVIFLFLILHLVILPKICKNVVYSVYFEPDYKRPVEEIINNYHILDIKNDLPDANIAVLVITSKRETSYLNRTLLSLFKEISRSEEKHPTFICSADPDHGELNELFVPASVKVLQPCLNSACHKFEVKEREKKYVRDFVACHRDMLEELKNDVKYVLCLEDDVALMDNFFPTLSSILSFRGSRLITNPWLDIKLYVMPRMKGFAFDIMPLVELLAMSCLLVFFLDSAIGSLPFIENPRKSFSKFLFMFILCICTVLAISRQGITHWRRIHPQFYAWRPVPNFGTPAVLYNRLYLEEALKHLEANKDALDISISRFRRKNKLAGFLLEPNLVRHLGIKSSLGGHHQKRRDNGDIREFLVNHSI